MKKAQRQSAGSVGDDDDKGGAPAAHDGRMLNFPLHQHTGAGVQRSDRVKPGPVLVPERQVKQQVLAGVNSQLVQ
jgi:hypothetical protein